MPFTAPSSWKRVDHPVSGLRRPTLNAPLRLGFPSAPHLRCLTLPDGATRRTVLQKVRRRTHAVLRQFVNAGFQVLFHSPPGVLFTFPSRYCALSVTKKYLALRGGPRAFPQGFSCLVVLWIRLRRLSLRLRGFHPLWRDFPDPSAGIGGHVCRPNPGALAPRFGLLRFRSPLLPKSFFIFFSSGYLDVSVHRVPLPKLWIGFGMTEVCSAGFPHSEIRGSKPICGSPRLIAAYRVFLRPLVPRHPPCALNA